MEGAFKIEGVELRFSLYDLPDDEYGTGATSFTTAAGTGFYLLRVVLLFHGCLTTVRRPEGKVILNYQDSMYFSHSSKFILQSGNFGPYCS